MSYEKTLARIESNKPVSANAWYEYCIAKGYHFNSDIQAFNMKALQTMKEHVNGSKMQASFLLYAEKYFHDINRACTFEVYRDYIKFGIGDVEYPKAIKYRDVIDMSANITPYLKGIESLDYAIDNREQLCKSGRIHSEICKYLGLLWVYNEYKEVIRHDFFGADAKSYKELLDIMGFDAYPVYMLNRFKWLCRNKAELQEGIAHVRNIKARAKELREERGEENLDVKAF